MELVFDVVVSVLTWLIPWLILSVVHASAAKSHEYVYAVLPSEGDIITQDGNNLFKTGIMYSIFFFVAAASPWPLLAWAALVAGVLFCIPPIVGYVTEVFLYGYRAYPWQVNVSRAFCTFVPLVTLAHLYFIVIAA